MIKLIDDQVGRILNILDATGQREDTIIIFTSDHGEALGDHGLIQKGCRFYEGLVRVPLIWSWRGHFSEDMRRADLVELSDIVPTLLEVCGLPIPEYVTGKSLLPILLGNQPQDAHRDFVRCEYIDALDLPAGSVATMYFDGRHKLIRYHRQGLGELYDLEADPGEFVDLWDCDDHQSLKLELLQRSYDSHMVTLYPGAQRLGPM